MSTSIARAPRRMLAGLMAGALALTGVAFSATTASAAESDRVGGENRYETAGLIAAEAFPEGPEEVILATGLNFPDALAASGLAGDVNAPILLTDPDVLSPETEDALADLDPTTVHIVGEEMAVSAAVEAELDTLGYDTPRIGGENRFGTAAEIAEAVGDNIADSTVFIATGENFPDALSAGPLAFEGPHPILLVNNDSIPAETEQALEDLGIDNTIILGETTAVSADVATELEAITGNEPTRIGGDTRYDTAIELAEFAVSDFGFDLSDVLLANGVQNLGVDALAGGPFGGIIDAPILLTTADTLSPETETYLESVEAGDMTIDTIIALGGPTVISDATLAEATAAATADQQEFQVTLSWINENTDAVDSEGSDDDTMFRQGEPGAEGSATLTLDPQADTVEYTLDYSEVTGPFDDAPGYHIHEGAIDENGPIVLTLATGAELDADDDQMISGTVDETMEGDAAESIDALIDDILANPDDYYLNVHSNAYPGGAIRGQLPMGGQDQIPPVTAGMLTDAPELVSAEVENQGTGFVNLRYTFDEDVTGQVAAAGCFHLYAFDFTNPGTSAVCAGGHSGDSNVNAASADGTNAFVDEDNNSQVVVRFDVDQEWFQSVTVTTVDWDAVEDAEGNENLEGQIGLKPVTFEDGRTAAPDLTDVQNFDTTDDTVEFVFDEDVDTGTVSDTGFSLIDVDGNTVMTSTAASVDQDDNNVVVATFGTDDIDADTEADTARAAADADAVSDDDTNPGPFSNPQQTIDVSNNGDTDAPDVVSVTVDTDENMVTYDFDTAVSLSDTSAPTDFQVYDQDGVETNATSVVRSDNDTSVIEATFGANELDDAIGASVDADAVESTTGLNNRENQVDEVAVGGGSAFAAGETVGPDLVSAEVRFSGDPTFGGDLAVIYTFDEDVTTGNADADAGRFFIYDEDGSPVRGVSADDSDDDTGLGDDEIRVTFSADETENDTAIQEAAVATVNDLAVTDDEGDANIEAAVTLTQRQ